MPPETMETPPFPGSPPLPGTEQAAPGRTPFDVPRLPSSTAALLLSPGTPRAAVWCSSGAVARGLVAVMRAGASRSIRRPNNFEDPMRRHHDGYRIVLMLRIIKGRNSSAVVVYRRATKRKRKNNEEINKNKKAF